MDIKKSIAKIYNMDNVSTFSITQQNIHECLSDSLIQTLFIPIPLYQ